MRQRLLCLVVEGLLAVGLCHSQPPNIEVTSIPAYGAWPGVLTGRVTGVNPPDYRVAALIFITGMGFYSKPYCDATTTPLGAGGDFSVLLTTGEIDQFATLIALLVVPATANVLCYQGVAGIPSELEQQAVAELLVPRPNPAQRVIEFSGRRWLVKSVPAPVGPGPNYFSDSPENVWVDALGRLHLRITYRDGRWNCAEVYSELPIGYGKYSFQLETVPEWDKNVVFGAFTWADAELVNREIDTLEVGRFGNGGDPNNAQNIVQPWDQPGHRIRFLLPAVEPTVHSMDWQAGSVYFRSVDAQGTVLHDWTYGDQPPSPDSPRLRYRLNLWLVAPPSDGQEAEVVVSHFSYTPNPGLFVPITPCRVVETRGPAGPFGGPALAAGQTRDFQIPAGGCGVPSAAQAYSFNVTVVPHGPLGYLTIWPAGQEQPPVSTLNSYDGRVKADAAIVPAGDSGGVSVFVTDTTDVILDINGYFVPTDTPSSLAFYPVTPCRVCDTRVVGRLCGGLPYLGGGISRTIPVRGVCGIPPEASAYWLNFTAVPHGPLGYITAWPTGTPMPLVSTLNAPTGTVTANGALVPGGTDGSIDVFAFNDTDLIVDISGYFAPPQTGGLSFYALPPCRVADTRNPNGPYGGPPLNGTRSFAVSESSCGVPDASAYSLNATVLPQAGLLQYLTLWPTGSPQPLVSTLNAYDGSIVSNAAIVPAASGSIDAFATDTTHLILDINGYFAP